jgi:hypothetical protein
LLKKENGIWKPKYGIFPVDYTAHMNFGKNVAMNASYIVASAAGANDYQGELYVYTYNNNSATYSTKLTAADGLAMDQLGYSLAMHNNVIIAGAPSNNIGLAEKQGSAYVFRFNGIWWQQTSLTQPGSHPYDGLGESVAIYGNYAVAGAPHAAINGQGAQGKVCIFQYNGSAWSYLTSITAPQDGANKRFGYSVSLSGDTLVVGSSENINNSTGTGKVYVYIRNGNAWNLQATLAHPDARSMDGFGASVHLNNGYLIVGAPGAWINATRRGKSYIYKPSAQGWALQAVLAASNGNEHDAFGKVVHINEHAAFCSAPYADVYEGDENGRIYFFNRSNP